MSRRGHGSTKVPNVKLKPVPKNGKHATDEGVGMYDPHATSGTARDALKDDKRPFIGLQICCTGVKDKASLFSKARELGAVCSNDFTDLTTHLVADAPGSAKYECAVKLGIPVLTSDWILDAHTKWLAGMDVDLEECIGEHLLPPLKGVVICTTRLTNADDRQRITKSAVRLGAAYQAHLDKAATHLLIGPDDGSNVDSQKLQWVKKMNEKRRLDQSDELLIHVVWDSWLLHCAVAGARVPEREFVYTENGERPDPPEDIERWLRKSSTKKPAMVYVTASSVGTAGRVGTAPGGKEVLEKARVRKVGQAETIWNSIISASQNTRDPDSFVPPTQMQQQQVESPSTPPRGTSPPPPVSSAPPPVLNVDDSATEDEEEDERNKASSSRAPGPKASVMAAPDPPTPAIQPTAPRNSIQLGTGKTTSMVSRLNSLRGSAFQLGSSDQNASASGSRTLARVASIRQEAKGDVEMAPPPLPTTVTPKVFAGKRIAPVGEARKVMLYDALRTHGAIVVGEPDQPDPKGKGKAKEGASDTDLPDGEVDYYIVRLSGAAAKRARELDCYDKFRTDCWVEHCIFFDRLCSPQEDLTYAPLKIQLPVPGADTIQLHWTGLNNEQETAAKRLAKVLGINVTDSFLRRVNTHLLCGTKSGLKYEKALQWKITIVDMDWLYAIAREGRVPSMNDTQVQTGGLFGNDTTFGPSVVDPTNVHATNNDPAPRKSPLLGASNGLLGPHTPPAEPAVAKSNNTVEPERNSGKVSVPQSSGEGSSTSKNGSTNQAKETESDREREREAHRNQLADSLGALLKKHQLDENAQQTEQPRKRARPLQRQKGTSIGSGSNARSYSLSEKVSSMSLQSRVSDPEYVSPLEAIEQGQEETLHVHYLDPNQHAAKENLLKLFEGSSQFPEAEVINLDTQTEPELSQEPAPPPPPKSTAKRKRGGAAGSNASSARRKSLRKA